MKITVIGNSVALRVRPPQKTSRNFTYLLREKLGSQALVENKALGATTITNWLQVNDQFINSFPDYFIINIGVVDSTIREVPLWFYRLANRKVDNILTKIVKGIYRGLIAKMRPLLSKIRGRRSWVSAKTFEKQYQQLFETILKETNAYIIAMPINITNDRIEKQLPGSGKNQVKFNEIIKKVTMEHHQSFLDLSDLKSEEHYPDGVHFNETGHKIVAERLIEIINEKQSRA